MDDFKYGTLKIPTSAFNLVCSDTFTKFMFNKHFSYDDYCIEVLTNEAKEVDSLLSEFIEMIFSATALRKLLVVEPYTRKHLTCYGKLIPVLAINGDNVDHFNI